MNKQPIFSMLDTFPGSCEQQRRAAQQSAEKAPPLTLEERIEALEQQVAQLLRHKESDDDYAREQRERE